MEKDEHKFTIDGVEIGEPDVIKVRSLGGGVKGITFIKKLKDFFRNPKHVKVHRVIENGRIILVLELIKYDWKEVVNDE